ncbi:MAG: Mrp/NBP35 family ATP-binding protein [Bacteroidota bacterium]|nr:Mrp/NBP35 family ATP-binding protein [Bacteroidota bacterium]
MNINRIDDVLNALRQVDDPDLGKDIVTLNMVQDLVVDSDAMTVQFRLVLTTPACPMKDLIMNACITAIKHLVSPDFKVTIKLDSKVISKANNKGINNMPNVKNIIAVASGKGGVGKSTVATNLALALGKLGAAVGLLDADIYGPSLPIMMGLGNSRPDIIQDGDAMKIVPFKKYEIVCMSIGCLVDEKQALIWRGPMISTALKQLMLDVEWGELDYLVIDMPPGTGDIYLTLSQQFPLTGVVIVTTPQQVAVADVKKSIEMFVLPAINVPILGIVENMSYLNLPNSAGKMYPFGQGGGANLSEEYGIPLLLEIPLLEGLASDADGGLPIVMNEHRTIEAKMFSSLAEQVARQVAILTHS